MKCRKILTIIIMVVLVTSGFSIVAQGSENADSGETQFYALDFTSSSSKENKWELMSIEKLDYANNIDPSISIDEGGNPHISYCSNNKLKYGILEGSTWDIKTINSSQVVNEYNSLALDSEGEPHIIFRGTDTKIIYAKKESGSWSFTAGPEIGDDGYASLSVDKSGTPHIIFSNSRKDTLSYGTISPDGWDLRMISKTKYAEGADIALDKQGNPHICWGIEDLNVEYLYFDGNKWSKKIFGPRSDDCNVPKIAIDNKGNPHISYFDREDNIKHATLIEGNMKTEIIEDKGRADGFSSIGVDENNVVHIIYLFGTDEDGETGDFDYLKYAKKSRDVWNRSIIEKATGDSIGSLAIDFENNLHIVYGNTINDEIKYGFKIESEDTTLPTADAGLDKIVEVGENFTLDASDSSDNKQITSYKWDLDNGETKIGKTITHTYDTQGEYTVTLTVTDSAGNTATDTIEITVEESGDTTPPTAEAGNDKTVEVGEEFTLDASGSSDNVGIASYEWDLGNGDTKTGEQITYTYDEAGNYTVELTVTDESGNTDTDTVEITVEESDDGDDDGGSSSDGGGTPGFTLMILLFTITLIAIYRYKVRK